MKLLVIAPIDGSSLTDTLQHAADVKIPVISYDRLIRGTPNVDYYATFDNFKVGVLQANYIVDKLGLAQAKGPINIELFAGSPDDNNATFFFDGAMSVLQALHRQAASSSSGAARPRSTRSPRCAGTAGWPSPGWTTC